MSVVAVLKDLWAFIRRQCVYVPMILVVACSSSSSHEPSSATPPSAAMFSQADAYERFMGRWSRQLAPAFIAFAEVKDGDDVLDIGSGTGVLAFAVRDTMKHSKVFGIDPSSSYVTYATKQNTDPRVRFEIGDAQHLNVPSSTYDKTLALLVMNFIPDEPMALKEMLRVTKPGGVVAAAVWDYAAGMQMLRKFWDEVDAFDPAIEPKDEAHMPLSKQGQLAELWKQVGLTDVREELITTTLHFASFDDYWSPFLLGQGPGGAYVVSLSRDRQQALKQRLKQRLLGDGPDHPIDMEARAWAVKGHAPS
jgi:SAM-dependent methyltransferase